MEQLKCELETRTSTKEIDQIKSPMDKLEIK